MATNRDAVREIITKAWESGRAKGLTDEEIISIIEDTLRQREEEREKKVVRINPPGQILYGPPPKMEEHVVVPRPGQVLYGPPPRMEEHVVVPGPAQVLYGPPPRSELQDMFNDEGEVIKNPKKGRRI